MLLYIKLIRFFMGVLSYATLIKKNRTYTTHRGFYVSDLRLVLNHTKRGEDMKELKDYLYYHEDNPSIDIYLGDCLEVMPLLEKVDLVISSPPYNIKGNFKPSGMQKESPRNISRDWYNDDMPEEEYQTWIKYVVTLAIEKCNGLVWINHKIRYRDKIAIHPVRFLDFPIHAEIIWDRGGSLMVNAGRHALSHEHLLAFGNPIYWDNSKPPLMSVLRIAPVSSAHPCGFPLEIAKRPINDTCPKNGIVLDMFSGGGTTLVACKELNRNGIGIEMSEKYCEITVKRLKNTQVPFL